MSSPHGLASRTTHLHTTRPVPVSGIQDLALSPDFETTREFFVYYQPHSPESVRVSAFIHEENGGGLTSRGILASERIVFQESRIGYDGTCCHMGASEF